MTANELRSRVLVRFYRWALEEARLELATGFPLLRCVKGSMALRTLRFLDECSPTDREVIVHAWVKRFHSEGMSLAGDAISPEEQTLIDRYLDGRQLVETPYEREVSEARYSGNPYPRAKRSTLTSRVKAELKRRFGVPLERWSSTTVRFAIPADGWVIHTLVCHGSPAYYLQGLWISDRERPIDGTSAFSYLGITGQTVWDLVFEGDEDPVATALALHVQRFIDGARDIIPDLGAAPA